MKQDKKTSFREKIRRQKNPIANHVTPRSSGPYIKSPPPTGSRLPNSQNQNDTV